MRAVLDCNIWDLLAQDDEARSRIAALVDSAALTIVIPSTLCRELEASPFDGVPRWFAVELILDGVAIVGHSRVGECRIGEAAVFQAHLGESRQAPDAVIVDTAHSYADVFVSEDRRARLRYESIADASRSVDYSTFRDDVLGLSPASQGESA